MDNEKCKTLIRLYGEKEFLWNSKLTGFRNKSAREQAWKQISETMRLPLPMLRSKMTNMLAAYRKEKSRIKQSKSPGSGRNGVYVSKWFAFDEFAFMVDKDTSSSKIDGEPSFCEVKSEIEAASDLSSFPIDPATFAETSFPDQYEKQRANSIANSADDEILKDAFRAHQESADAQYKDPYYTFGQYIANELRKYDSYTLTHVKRAISNVIFDADLGKYSHGNYGETMDTSQQQNGTT